MLLCTFTCRYKENCIATSAWYQYTHCCIKTLCLYALKLKFDSEIGQNYFNMHNAVYWNSHSIFHWCVDWHHYRHWFLWDRIAVFYRGAHKNETFLSPSRPGNVGVVPGCRPLSLHCIAFHVKRKPSFSLEEETIRTSTASNFYHTLCSAGHKQLY